MGVERPRRKAQSRLLRPSSTVAFLWVNIVEIRRECMSTVISVDKAYGPKLTPIFVGHTSVRRWCERDQPSGRAHEPVIQMRPVSERIPSSTTTRSRTISASATRGRRSARKTPEGGWSHFIRGQVTGMEWSKWEVSPGSTVCDFQVNDLLPRMFMKGTRTGRIGSPVPASFSRRGNTTLHTRMNTSATREIHRAQHDPPGRERPPARAGPMWEGADHFRKRYRLPPNARIPKGLSASLSSLPLSSSSSSSRYRTVCSL